MNPARGLGVLGVRSTSAIPTRIGPAGVFPGSRSSRSSVLAWYADPSNPESSTGQGPTTSTMVVAAIASRQGQRRDFGGSGVGWLKIRPRPIPNDADSAGRRPGIVGFSAVPVKP